MLSSLIKIHIKINILDIHFQEFANSIIIKLKRLQDS